MTDWLVLAAKQAWGEKSVKLTPSHSIPPGRTVRTTLVRSIPPIQLNYELVQVVLRDAGGELFQLPFQPLGREGCSGADTGGWYYAGRDENRNPTQIAACACSCALLENVSVEIWVDCVPGFG